MKSEKKYVIALTSLYFIVSLLGILHHELWLDESHHWLISRDSMSFMDLLENTRYEGHPIFWNILLFAITRFTLEPVAMQLLHIAISTLATAVFLGKAPFNLVFKILFIFGYFMLFEYNIISRNYALGVLFLFLACGLFETRRKNFVWLCVVLALAANMHLMFAVISFAILLTVMFENLESGDITRYKLVFGSAVFAFGVLLLIYQVFPTGENAFFNRVNAMPLSEKFSKGFISLFKGIVVIPDFTSVHFWNSNLVVNISKLLAGIFGLALYALPLLLFRKKATLFFCYLALFGVQIFFFVLQLGATRYDGMTYLIIVVALWIDSYLPRDEFKWRIVGLTKLRRPITYSILLLHFTTGIYAYCRDFRIPFTTAKEAVEYLDEHGLQSADVLSVTCDGTLYSPYLKKKVWFLCEDSLESYCHWYAMCPTPTDRKMVVDAVSKYVGKHGYAVYVSGFPLDDSQSGKWTDANADLKIRFRKKTGESIVRNNSLYIYEVAKIR